MAIANKILREMDEKLPLVKPVVRHGLAPKFHKLTKFSAKKIAKVYDGIRANGHSSIAIICKTTADAMRLTSELLAIDINAQMLEESSVIDQQAILVVPSHLSKGLEFDAVIIVADEQPFENTPLERKLLYVAITRAMHELHFIGPNKNYFLL